MALFPPGFKIDQRYEVIKTLGSGFSGEVLLVKDGDGLKALKLLKTVQINVSAAEALANFRREFSILQGLNHPHVARIMDFGLEPKLKKYYFTTEFVDGLEMHKACEGVDVETTERLILQVLRALNYLHARGIFHYDLKPQNILIEIENGRPVCAKIIDFGLAGFAAPGKKAGTPAYMAPEVIEGRHLDGRTDIYAMGVLIYRVLTGLNPFAGKSLKETFEKQMTLVPPRPSSLSPALPKWWDHIVARMIEKNPDRRYSQASQIIRDLNYLSNQSFDIETEDTRLSYLPESGALIGREEEWRAFTALFAKVFESERLIEDKVLLVAGPRGVGKTRLLREIKHYAQLKNVPVRTAQELREGECPQHFILAIDDETADVNTVNAIVQEFAKERCLVLWAAEELPRHWHSSQVIRLGNFDKTQLKAYLESVTGFERTPAELIDGIHERTLGNPFFVTEFVKALLRENVLFDAVTGQWKAENLADLRVDFDKIRVPGTIEEAILESLADLTDVEKEVLNLLAVHGEALEGSRIIALTAGRAATEALLHLVGSGILRDVSGRQSYAFANLLFSSVITKSLGAAELEAYHDRLAAVFSEEDGGFDWLVHVGYGSNEAKAVPALERLGAKFVEKKFFKKAADAYEKIRVMMADQRDPRALKALFEIGQCFFEMRDYDAARDRFERLREFYLAAPDAENSENLVKVHYKLIDIQIHLGGFSQAGELIAGTSLLLAQSPSAKTGRLILKNYEGLIIFRKGDPDRALEILEKSYAQWRDELSLDEKRVVGNNHILHVLTFKNDHRRIISFIESHLPILEKLANIFWLAEAHYYLGEAFRRQASFESSHDAEALYRKAFLAFERTEDLARQIHNTSYLLRAYNGMGNVCTSQNQMDEALKHYERALVIAQKSDIEVAAAIAINVANIHKQFARYDDAYSCLVYSINTLENLPHRSHNAWFQLFNSYFELAEVHIERDELAKAHQTLDVAERIHSENGFKIYGFWVPFLRGRAFDKEGRQNETVAAFERAEALIANDFEKAALARFRSAKAASVTKVQEPVGDPNGTPSSAVNPLPGRGLTAAKTDAQDALKTILHVTQALNSDLDLASLFKLVLSYALEITRAEAGFILLLNDAGELKKAASQNKPSGSEAKISLSLARQALTSGAAVSAASAKSDARFNSSRSVVAHGLESILCLPIRARGKTVGVFYLDDAVRKNAFADCDPVVLDAFCHQVGIAIDNARVIEELKTAKTELEASLNQTRQELSLVKDVLERESGAYHGRYDYAGILTRSQAMFRVFGVIDKITETALAVFLHGASGTGKELLARALHHNHPRRAVKKFVAVNCSALPGTLMESELFGHKAGSFTGADKDREGLIAEAHGGTLFLDEIADLDFTLQAKLLRFLQEGEIRQIGANAPRKVDVRVVSASHKNLAELVRLGKFREDLFYRLCQIQVDVPLLRERPEDLLLLAKHFVGKFRRLNGVTEEIEIGADFGKALLVHDWPGNVRELENLIFVACALCEDGKLTLETLPQASVLGRTAVANPAPHAVIAQNPASQIAFSQAIDSHNDFDPALTLKDYETLILAKCFEKTGRKKIHTARLLGLSHTTVYKRVRALGLDDAKHPALSSPFVYDESLQLADYVARIFAASLAYHDKRPAAAIKQLGISSGYFYKVMKAARRVPVENRPCFPK